ncbi:MAG: rod shape-determining protein RodA [Methylacidiphilales bacterium]|nr:rod shape-determining protein RodA [Candidatus Methylacidiphilales bacterium]
MRILFRKLGQIGWSLPVLVALLVLCVASVFVIISATYANDALRDAPGKQCGYILAGVVAYLALALTPYQQVVKIGPILYPISLALLIGVFFYRASHGAHSWIRLGPLSFEPAEFAKLTLILSLAWFFRVRENQMHKISTVLIALAITLIPFILIKKQPALGSAGVFIPVFLAMLFAAGARMHHLLLLMLLGLLGVGGYYLVSTKSDQSAQIAGVHNFQVDRIKSWVDPTVDKQGAAWQINQSMIAIGSGGLQGKVPLDYDTLSAMVGALRGKADVKSWMADTQTALGYLPKNTSYNDLIFSVVGELFGFRGGAVLIICEGTVLLWCLWVAAHARDKVGTLVAVGVMTMLFTHVFVNIGMTIQVVPITGIPLPFISYGGTFLIACLAAMGLVQSVWVHRKNFERR